MKPAQPAITLEEIYSPVESSLQKIPDTINDILSTSNELAADVIAYFFSARGKLLRPVLTLIGACLKQGAGSFEADPKLLKLAASYEIFHAATLIHDDIIDSAYLRRNLPTVNVKWGPQIAVLVGDFLHDKALGTIFQSGNEKIFSRFLETAGTVCDGEIHELNEKFNFVLTEKDYFEIIRKKTAVLLACSLEAGGLYAGANPREAEALRTFGDYFGLAFQIVDDCLDFMGNEHEFGKTLGADCTAGVLTLPLIRLLAVLDNRQKNEVTELFKNPEDAGKFKKIFDLIREHGTLDYALDKAREFSQIARSALLNMFSDHPARRSLERLLDYVLERNR